MTEIKKGKRYCCTSGSSYQACFTLTCEEIESVAHGGQNDDDVAALMSLYHVKKQIEEEHDNIIKVFPEVCYDWEDEGEEYWTFERKAAFVLWDACWQAMDGDCDEV